MSFQKRGLKKIHNRFWLLSFSCLKNNCFLTAYNFIVPLNLYFCIINFDKSYMNK